MLASLVFITMSALKINRPYSVDDVRNKEMQVCSVSAEFKPDFYKALSVPLVKSTQPFERLTMILNTLCHSRPKFISTVCCLLLISIRVSRLFFLAAVTVVNLWVDV